MSTTKMIFVNLPVADLAKATAFYEAVLGATKNPQFSDETASCMVLSEAIHVMLLTHDKFRQFTPRKIADRDSVEVLNCLLAESREAVDQFADLAAKAGGKADHAPSQDHGFMYSRSVEDPDGHVWEIMFMDMAAAQTAMAKP